jgi:hypothetical protein
MLKRRGNRTIIKEDFLTFVQWKAWTNPPLVPYAQWWNEIFTTNIFFGKLKVFRYYCDMLQLIQVNKSIIGQHQWIHPSLVLYIDLYGSQT